jgi:ribonucleoside-diphosphate reductase beta chain
MLNGVEHANFFETRATEYSKAATKGQWSDVWDAFDRRKTAGKVVPAANEDVLEAGLFGDGVAAE